MVSTWLQTQHYELPATGFALPETRVPQQWFLVSRQQTGLTRCLNVGFMLCERDSESMSTLFV
jgi:hypothetical protein